MIYLAKAVEVKVEDEGRMEKEYYCTECNRTHTKGKIFKEHLKYAKGNGSNGNDSEEEKKGVESKTKNSEKVEKMPQDFEEEMELVTENEESLEIDEKPSEEDEEDAESKSGEEGVDLNNAGAQAVKKLSGVGDATLKKLIKAGFGSLEAIAFTPPKIIQEESGLGEKTTEKLIKESMEKLNIRFKSAEEVWEFRKNIARITTSSQELDDLLGGGIETGGMTEFFGEFRTGKTQIMHQICVNVQLPREKGGLDGCALYIDTEGTFRPERIIQMAEAKDMDPKKVLKNIVFGRAYNSDHQVLLVKEASNLIKEKNIKVIIVDSLIGHFRSEYIGRGTLANRQQFLNQHIHDLLRLCDVYPELAVLVTNQVQAKPDVFYGNPLQAAGGNIVAHGSTIRIFLRKGKGEQRIAKMVDAPNLPEGEAIFTVTTDGIGGE